MRLGFLLTCGPGQPVVESCIHLTQAALAQGHEVDIFLLEDGLRNAVQPDASRAESQADQTARFLALADAGAEIVVCAQAAVQRGIAPDQLDDAVTVGGLFDLALLIRDADRFVSLT